MEHFLEHSGREPPNGAPSAGARSSPHALSVNAGSAVDLILALSHQELTEFLRCAEQLERRPLQRRTASGGARRRLRCGAVTDAVVAVLQEAGTDMRYIDVFFAVEERLGVPVSRSAVKNALAEGTRGKRQQRFERVSHGRYRLLT
jgi:hypothetical protein